MICLKCNSEIRDDSKFCSKCGTKCGNIKSSNVKPDDEHEQDLKIGKTKENFAKNEQTIESDVQKSLEIIELNQNGVVKGIISIIFGIIGAYVFSICFDRMFGGIMLSVFGWVILFACLSNGIRSIATAKKKAYKATCPYCKHEFAFPVENLNALCPQCNKKIIIKDNKFQIVE